MIRRTQVTAGPAVGADGSAVASGISEEAITGMILAVHYERVAEAVSTTDTVLQEAYKDPAKVIHSVTNLAADGWHAIATTLVDQDNNTLVGPVGRIDVIDQVELSISGANTDSIVRATIEWDDGKD